MASTTEELTGQSDQLISALGFFRTGDQGQGAAPARTASVRSATPAKKQPDAAGHHAARSSVKRASNSGVALKMKESGDAVDQEFERY